MEETKSEKQAWLLKLEEESWQAELIISGLAILGSLQLPDLIDELGQWAFTYFSTDLGFFLLLFLVFLHFSSGILLFSFIIHFILRGVWIGFIGLNSVFPEGIKTDGSGMYSEIFMRHFKKDYIHKNYGIESLDKFCSAIFGLCTLVLLFSLVFCSSVFLLYGIYYLLSLVLPEAVIEILSYVFFVAAVIPSIAVFILKQDKYKENERLQTRFYKFFNVQSILLFHIFRRPTIYLSFLFSTNLKIKQYLFAVVGIFIFLYGFSFYRVINSGNILLANSDAFFKSYERTDRAFAENYEEFLTEKSSPIYSALIPSKLIAGKMLKVFVPIFENEESVYTTLCGELVDIEGERAARNKHRWQYYANCYQQYHKFYVNDKLYEPQLVKFTHPHKNQEGILTYIPTDKFKVGKNILRVDKIKNDKVEPYKPYRVMQVPFWFEGE